MTAPMGLGAVVAAELFDDAALFPPGNASMADAVPAHLERCASGEAGYVGPFVVPDRRLGEFVDTLNSQPGRTPIRVSLIATDRDLLPDALAGVRGTGRVRLVAVETAVGAASDPAHEIARTRKAVGKEQVPVYAEPGWGDNLEAIIAEAAAQGARVKLRTGGTSADAFPTSARLAAALSACLRLEVAFKCTAGLHHAVRHTDPVTGFEHHGFLNVCLAASQDASVGLTELEAALDERDGAALVRGLDRVEQSGVGRGRERFRSFGTCSIDEPLTDLAALGLLRAR